LILVSNGHLHDWHSLASSIAMIVKKRFMKDGDDLDACMDQLVEVLAQLLEEPTGHGTVAASSSVAHLHSGDARDIHVVESKSPK
jgi:hypothetical protein